MCLKGSIICLNRQRIPLFRKLTAQEAGLPPINAQPYAFEFEPPPPRW